MRMRAIMRRALVLGAVVVFVLGVSAVPASGTAHEITGMWCSNGNAVFNPPGVSGGSNADNFVQPLVSTKFIESVEPFAGDGVNGPGVLVTFDFDHPASKLVSNGEIWFVGDGTYITGFELDGDHGFANCFG
jgi:hypothetical protein